MHSIISFFASIDPNLYNIGIFAAFLIYNLMLGLRSGKGITTLAEFALGGRNFSTSAIAATIVATCICGVFFFTIIIETYKNGLYYIWGTITSELVIFLLIGLVFAPRMAEFLGKLSVAEAMGSVYGEKIRIITAISGCIGITGLISVQLKAAGMAVEYAIGAHHNLGVIIIGGVITIYSALGGIRAVTFTDIFQFITFGVVIPIVLFLLAANLVNTRGINDLTKFITTSPLFRSKEVFDFSQPKSLYFLFLFIFYSIPSFSAPLFQRVSMARNTSQATKAFTISAFTCFVLAIAVAGIGVLTMILHPNINPDDVVRVVIEDCSKVFLLKGLVLAGIMAIIMSSVDSYINATSVMVVNDLLNPLNIKIFKNDLTSARAFSWFIGAVAIALSLRQGNLLKLAITANSFYKPIITVPFILMILGFRSSIKSVLTAMIAGMTTVILWNYFNIKIVDSVVPAMFANLVVLMGSHYLFKQKGGWVGIKKPEPLIRLREARKQRIKNFIYKVKNFSFYEACKINYPRGDRLLATLGWYVMFIIFSAASNLSVTASGPYTHVFRIFYPIALFSSTALIGYPFWSASWKRTKAIGLIWNAIAFYSLICFSWLMVLISNFTDLPLVIFTANILVISALVRWQWALFLITFGVFIVTFCYNNYIAIDVSDTFGLNSKIIYFMVVIGSAIILFQRPRQLYQRFTEEKVEHLEEKIIYQGQALEQALTIKNEFIRNISHETHIPVGVIVSNAQILWEKYDNLTDDQRRQAARDISKSGDRLISLTDNMIDLSKLSSMNPELTIINMNISELVQSRLAICQRLYLENRPIEFHRKIEDNLYAECDGYYIRQTMDNLIINAIIYGKKGNVNIGLRRADGMVEFSIEDEGIGIPLSELYDIFGAFTVSSKTRTPAGGRGVGLALCKRAIDVHLGNIWAESDGIKGSIFKFTLPVEYKGTQGKKL